MPSQLASFGARAGYESYAAARLIDRLECLLGAELLYEFINRWRPGADALIVLPSAMLSGERRRIQDFAAKHRLPSMSTARESGFPSPSELSVRSYYLVCSRGEVELGTTWISGLGWYERSCSNLSAKEHRSRCLMAAASIRFATKIAMFSAVSLLEVSCRIQT